MTDEIYKWTEKDYNDHIDMFESSGWQYFISQTKELEETLTRGAIDNAPTNDTWQFLRGQLMQLRALLGWENYIKISYEQQQLDEVLGDAPDTV